MRKWMYQTVDGLEAASTFAAGGIHTSGGTEGDDGPSDAPAKPFIVIRLGTNQQIVRMPGSKVKQQLVQVWLHTEPGTMLPTDEVAAALEEHVPAQAPAKTDEFIIIAAEWMDTSGDGYDDHYGTETRYVTFLVTFKAVP